MCITALFTISQITETWKQTRCAETGMRAIQYTFLINHNITGLQSDDTRILSFFIYELKYFLKKQLFLVNYLIALRYVHIAKAAQVLVSMTSFQNKLVP